MTTSLPDRNDQPNKVPTKGELLRTSIRDLGWFSFFLAGVVGAPNILALTEIVLDLNLGGLFQWIVDGYQTVTRVMDKIVAPLVQLIIYLADQWFSIELKLHEHWRYLFVLFCIPAVAGIRVFRALESSEGVPDIKWREVIFYCGAALLASIIAGFVPPVGTYAGQTIAVALPLLVLGAVHGVAGRLQGLSDVLLGILPIVFYTHTLVYFSISQSSAIAAFAIFTFYVGAQVVNEGLNQRSTRAVKVGMTTLGSFIAAGIVIVCSVIVQWFG